MPQETNLNVSPYFDDFDENKNYYKVLFKPGYPIQARELTTLQSILQNQIEQQGKNIFKEGSVVIPGQIKYESPLYAVEVDSSYNGISLSSYFSSLLGKKIQGLSSGVTAEVVYLITDSESERGNYTLYLKYLQSGGADFTNKFFQDAETLVTLSSFSSNGFVFQSGQGICNTIAINSTSEGSAVSIANGVYFVRGIFANVNAQTIILDQYNSSPSYKVGFNIIEKIVTSDEDESLFDNAQSFSNYSAPGADRFQLELELSKRFLEDTDTQNFVELFRVTAGKTEFFNKNVQYNLIRDEISRRTADISGDFVVNPFSLSVKDSLNDNLLNRGLFFEDQLTIEGNSPSEDLMVYQIGPGKAYVNGYDVETASTNFIDIQKTRTTATVNNSSINYGAGVLCIVNNAYGAPNIGIITTSTIKLMDSRIGTSAHVQSGTEIGSARIYDFVPETDYVDDTSRLHLRLFDIETYTKINLTTEITLNTPAVIKGKRSKAVGYLRENISNSKTLTLYGVSGIFSENEPISINEIDNTRLITSVADYNLSDVKSVYSNVGITTFNADVVFDEKILISPSGTEYNVNSGIVSTGLNIKFNDKIKVGDIITYNNTTFTGDPIYNKVVSISADGSSFNITGITTVTGVCDGKLASGSFNVINISKLNNSFLNQNSSLYTVLGKRNVNSVSILNSQIVQRKVFKSQTIQSNKTLVIDIDSADVDIYFDSFDEDKYIITYSDGTIEPMRFDKFELSNFGKRVTFRGLAKSSGIADVIATVINRSPSSKNKKFNKTSSLVVSNSKYSSSGIGTTTLNDGLQYSVVYGTRVQDEEICLNVPDVVRVLSIYESSGVSDPQLPNLQLTSFSGPSNNNSDYSVGERIIGKTSNAIGIIISKKGTDRIEYVNLNSFNFEIGEFIEGKDSKIISTVSDKFIGDKNITKNYLFDDGQREHFYDYSRIIRKSGIEEPGKKLKIIFQNYTIDSNDSGEFVTANSYPAENYKYDVLLYKNIRLTDLIDTRPRVSPYTLSSKSPFEFDSRSFAYDGQYSGYILASGESINLSYSYYQGRIDLINLNSDGSFEVIQGIPSDTPTTPTKRTNCLDIAYVFIPPYVYDVKNVEYDFIRHKRYTMSDISSLEDRIERIERYTTLSMLESRTENLIIKDAETGLDRFKCGFFVDNFSTHDFHDLDNPYFNSAIDETTNTLRPRHHTTSINLEFLPTTGVSQNSVRKEGNLVTLNYNEVQYFEQPYATKTENVTPFLVRFWQGYIDLKPPLDEWTEIKDLGVVKTFSNKTTTTETATTNNGRFVGRDVRVDNPNPQTGNISDSFDWIENANTWLSTVGIPNWKGGPLKVFTNENNENKITVRIYKDRLDSSRPDQVFDAINSLYPPDLAAQFISQVNEQPAHRTIAAHFYPPETTTQNIKPTTQIITNGNTRTTTSISETLTTISQKLTIAKDKDLGLLRSRNIEFSANGLKPLTKFYSFFGGVSVDNYVTPKLLEIEMISGTFTTGEIVESDPLFTTSKFRFKLCSPNHKSGDVNSPEKTIKYIPYTQQSPPLSYSSSSTFLNVDTTSLQLPSEVEFYGKASIGMTLIGKSSGARAKVSNIRLVSDSSGSLIGSLFIPDPSIQENPRWTNRENEFTLIDIPSLNPELTPLSNESQAEGLFISNGILKERSTIVYSTVLSRIIKNVENRTVRERIDPLAQSFYVTEKSGVFLSSVEVYFENKDDELPVILQIRPMISGVPSNIVVPFSEITLTPDEVNLSSDGSVSTKFTFPSPVYLNGAQENNVQSGSVGSEQTSEYAVVLLSNSPNYRVFISELGKNDILQQNVKVTSQPTLGSLFKSQNGSVWTPSQLEDLKFKLNRCDFVNQGVARFVNPKLSNKNGKVTVTSENQFVTLSKKVVVGLGSTGYNSTQIVPGVTLIQNNAKGTLTGIAGSIKVGVGVTIINSGAGYTGAGTTFTNVSLITETGFGSGATVNININATTSGIGTVTVVNGGSGYQVGDSLLIPEIGSGIGYGGKVSVISIGSSNAFVIDNVQGTFASGSTELSYINSSGITTSIGAGVTVSVVTEDQYYTGKHMKVYQINHAMHSSENYVKISKFRPNISEANSKLAADIDSSATTISLTTGTGIGFTQFEGVSVSSSNIGYVIIGEEVIGYTNVSGDTLESSLELRGIDSTEKQSYATGTSIYKYELEGVSLRRINKVHNLSLVDKDKHSTDLNSYHIQIEMGETDYAGIGIGSDRSNDLYFTKLSQTGNTGTNITNNIQYEVITPLVGAMVLPKTNILARMGSVTGTSIGGNENSFENAGYEEIGLNYPHYFNSPRLVCSEINESKINTGLPENKSLYMELLLTSENSFISPVIDTTQISTVLTSNLINNPIGVNDNEGYSNDDSVRSLSKDKHSAVYLSKLVRLKLPANSLKVILSANISTFNDIRVLYQTYRSDSPNNGDSFDLFPGYSNYEVDSLGIKRVIDYSKNDGSSDSNAIKSDNEIFNEYEYSIDNLADFDSFRIKIVMSSENQAKPPLIKDLRGIATLKPTV